MTIYTRLKHLIINAEKDLNKQFNFYVLNLQFIGQVDNGVGINFRLHWQPHSKAWKKCEIFDDILGLPCDKKGWVELLQETQSFKDMLKKDRIIYYFDDIIENFYWITKTNNGYKNEDGTFLGEDAEEVIKNLDDDAMSEIEEELNNILKGGES